MSDPAPASCPFCFPAPERIAFEHRLVRALWDAFPVSPGHLLVVPRRHVATWFDATEEERAAILKALDEAKVLVDSRHHPDGYNIGINVGRAAGQTVFHLHVHLIPRYSRDVEDPRGGVRHVIPGKGNYLVTRSAPSGPPRDEKAASQQTAERPYAPFSLEQSPRPIESPAAPPGPATKPRLVSGGEHDPLLPYLGDELARAAQADIAVGFVMPSGLDQLERHIKEFLQKGGRLRLLTGDYLGVTEPDALVRLLDLEGERQLRVYETARPTGPQHPGPIAAVSFHPKAYVFERRDGTGVAFVGSSNLSESALTTGIEWNYRVVDSADQDALKQVRKAFDELWLHPATTELTRPWIDAYRKRRPERVEQRPRTEVQAEPRNVPTPHEIQQEALKALEATRASGNTAGLVVLATGLGKTWLAAFDTNRPEYRRVLFVAHREEILNQSRDTFRRIRPDARLGFYKGEEREADADVLFASIQTLGRTAHLERFARDAFDYIVVDEFHHASARTYRRLIDYFRPKFLLGLTATPERTDGGDLLGLCQENLVHRCDVIEGITRGQLCRFQYFGVPDEVDYRNIPWKNARFDEEELTNHVATRSRARNAYEQLQKRGGTRTIAFCVSQRHADFMAAFFREQRLRAVAVHSGDTSAPRAQSLDQLSAGHLDVICAVDVFNEGLDLPELDTVLMLRPTESAIVWQQQFGRGLRKTTDDKRLTVIDYIGNHRSFLLKPQTLFGLPATSEAIIGLIENASRGPIEIAPGCFVTYDLETIDILKALAQRAANKLDALKRYYQDYVELHGTRPTAAEAFRDGYNPRAVRQQTGSWLAFVRSAGGLTPEQASALDRHGEMLAWFEKTDMTKSYKMLVLQAMLNEDRFPGDIPIAALGEAVLAIASRNRQLREDLGPKADTSDDLRAHMEENPIKAWTGGLGTGETAYFAYENGVFRTTFNVDAADRAALQELTREIVDWRLADYLDRAARPNGDSASYVCKVSHANGRPILFLPDRKLNSGLPEGTTLVDIDGVSHEADFVKVALNVVRRTGETENRLPEILRGWFGTNTGLAGTRHEVVLYHREGAWQLRPKPMKARLQT